MNDWPAPTVTPLGAVLGPTDPMNAEQLPPRQLSLRDVPHARRRPPFGSPGSQSFAVQFGRHLAVASAAEICTQRGSR